MRLQNYPKHMTLPTVILRVGNYGKQCEQLGQNNARHKNKSPLGVISVKGDLAFIMRKRTCRRVQSAFPLCASEEYYQLRRENAKEHT